MTELDPHQIIQDAPVKAWTCEPPADSAGEQDHTDVSAYVGPPAEPPVNP